MTRLSAARRSLSGWLLAGAMGIGLVAVPAGAQVDQQLKQQRQMREQQYRSVERMVNSMRTLKATRVDEVFRLKVVDGKLTCELGTAIEKAGSGSQFAVKVPELPGPTYVGRYQAFARQLGGPLPAGKAVKPAMAFSLQSTMRPDDDTLVNISVSSQPDMFQISKSIQMGIGRFASIQLIEQSVYGAPGIELRAFDQSSDDGTGQSSVNVSATDFETLRREYPREVEKHLRPLLREIGQEHLLAPDARVAWQVLNEYWPTDEAVMAKVKALLPGLNDASYRQREQVMGELIALGRPGVAAMLRMSRVELSPDASVMVGRAVAAYCQLSERQAEKLSRDKSFLLDCLLIEDPEIRKAAISQLRKVTSLPLASFDSDRPASERSGAVRSLRAELGLGPQLPATRPATTQPAASPDSSIKRNTVKE